MGGSAGVGILLLAAIPSETVAVASLLLLALFTISFAAQGLAHLFDQPEGQGA